jgi:nucleolin
MENKKLFLGNVAFESTTETITQIFSQYGEVVEVYKPERKGFAFVTFKDAESAAKAKEAMNGQEIDGRAIAIDFARPREDKPRFDNGGPRRFERRF